eukprot:scaffold177046_cov30-Prasinocladus_malaysianus.AAC.1
MARRMVGPTSKYTSTLIDDRAIIPPESRQVAARPKGWPCLSSMPPMKKCWLPSLGTNTSTGREPSVHDRRRGLGLNDC